MGKYLLIDGNNLAIRCAFANDDLTNQAGIPTGVHYGFFNSLMQLKKQFSDYQFLIAWDGKSKRRMEESEDAVKKGIISSVYKDNRKKGDETPLPILKFFEQSDFLKKGIGQLGIPQIRLSDFEADDILASYARKLSKENNKVVIVTSDRDYWQLLDENTSLCMSGKQVTKDSWEQEHGIKCDKVVDMGAFCGDAGDNIFGIPGWGEKTAIKELKKYGSMEEILKAYHKKYDPLRKKYPDIVDEDEFLILKDAKNDPKKPNSKFKFPEININLPFTGVCKAFHEGEIKVVKTELMALVFEERLHLSFSLKKMDDCIKDLPEIESQDFNRDRVIEFMEFFDIYTLHDQIDVFNK